MRHPTLVALFLTLLSACNVEKTLEDMVEETVAEMFGDIDCPDQVLNNEAAQAGREAAYKDMENEDWCATEPVYGISEANPCYSRAYNVAYEEIWFNACVAGDTADSATP